MGGHKGEDELHPEVWSYEGPTVDGSARFKVGDAVEVSGAGGPYSVTAVAWDGDWVYALPIPVDRAPACRHVLREQRADGRWLDRAFYPQTHLRFCRRSS